MTVKVVLLAGCTQSDSFIMFESPVFVLLLYKMGIFPFPLVRVLCSGSPEVFAAGAGTPVFSQPGEGHGAGHGAA